MKIVITVLFLLMSYLGFNQEIKLGPCKTYYEYEDS